MRGSSGCICVSFLIRIRFCRIMNMMLCTTFLDWISTALVREPINVWLLLLLATTTSPISPINRVPSSFASDHLPDPSFGGMADSPSTTTGNSRIVGVGKFDIDDDDVTFSWRRSFCVVLSSLPLVSQLGTVRLAEAIYSQRDVERGKNGVQEYRGLTHAVESSGSYAGPAARHMFVRLHEVP